MPDHVGDGSPGTDVMETRKERIKRASARRRSRNASGGVGLAHPLGERSNRKFFYMAAGTVVIALVAFVCGVEMGKALSELRGAGEPGVRDQDRKGPSPPFRFMERGKETQAVPAPKVGNSVAGERPKDGEGAPLQPTAKAGDGKPPGAAEEKAAPPKPKYALQVAAFNNSVEAQEMVNRLKKKGYDAYQVTGNAAAKGTLHLVRIGHFESLQEARQFALTFEKKENVKPIISSGPNP
jgi:hypothetical protein